MFVVVVEALHLSGQTPHATNQSDCVVALIGDNDSSGGGCGGSGSGNDWRVAGRRTNETE